MNTPERRQHYPINIEHRMAVGHRNSLRGRGQRKFTQIWFRRVSKKKKRFVSN